MWMIITRVSFYAFCYICLYPASICFSGLQKPLQGNLVIANGFGGKADNYVKAELRGPFLNLDICSKISPCIHVL